MLAPAAFPAFFLTLAGLVLLLLVTLSVPIIHDIYLLHVTGSESGLSVDAHLGVFGICYGGVSGSVLGQAVSVAGACTHPSVGYSLDTSYFGSSVSSSLANAVKDLSASLVLNAIACGLAGLSLFFAFFAYCCASRLLEILTLLVLVIAQIAAWLSFALDLALALVARHKIRDYTDDAFTGQLGNAIWLALGGAVALSLAGLFACCGVFGRYSSRHARYVDAPVGAEPKAYPRRRFWQRKTAPTYNGTY
ncbi:hypothetical protein Q5752_000355 [Cryptotrichosporon argae]